MTNLASNLFSYLRDLTSLRHKVIRSVDEYKPFVLWFADVPREKECLTPAWFLNSDNTVPDDIWLIVKKPKAAPIPALPTDLRSWVNDSQLHNADALPEPYKKIDMPGKPGLYIEFSDYPKLEKEWLNYLEKSWLPWAEDQRRIGRIQKTYTALHEMYQEKKKLGEQYELVLGVGLLCWNTQNNQKVMRHLIVAEADIVLDANKGTITIVPGIGSSGERAKTTLEQEMVEANHRPSPDVQNEIERHISSIGNNIWNSELVDSSLKKWLADVSSSADSVYSRTISKPVNVCKDPTITFAPCLILRKRTERGLLKILDDISKKLTNQAEIPANISNIAGISNLTNELDNDTANVSFDTKDLHFPLPWNDEQVRIVERLHRKDAILVQGPPGTGKSHTIVNLICHLLADGKRILVTSQTPRALKVLQDMMESKEETKEIASLCVSLLGSDSKSLKNLERSVHSISDKQYSWNLQENKDKIQALTERLDKLRREDASLKQKLREIRCSETEQHSLMAGIYKGTLQQIAIRLSNEKLYYSWISMGNVEGDTPPFSNQEAKDLLYLARYFTNDKLKDTLKTIPAISELPTVEDFVRYSDIQRSLQGLLEKRESIRNQPFYSFISAASTESKKALIDVLKKFISEKTNIEGHIRPWSLNALNEILSDQDRGWRVLLENTKNLLRGLIDTAKIADQTKIHPEEIYEGNKRTIAISDAKQLHSHLSNGGKIKVLLNAKEVKNAMYLIKTTRVNGRLCDNVDSLNTLICCLETHDKLEILWKHWAHVESKLQRSLSEQVAMIEDLCEPIEASLNLYSLMAEAKTICRNIVGLPEPAWRDTVSLEQYMLAAETAIHDTNLQKINEYFSKYSDKMKLIVTNHDPHDVCERILLAVNNRDTKAYSVLIEQLKYIEEEKDKYSKQKQMLSKMYQYAPEVANEIQRLPNDPAWDTKMAVFNESWYWARADKWVKERLDKSFIANLNSDIDKTQKQIKQIIGDIASTLAWGHCLERLSKDEGLSQHLRGWAHAVRRYGKGTGKWAFKHLNDARTHMEECRTAIPAWIMPLYRVADSVRPERGLYDVAIIDEASQSGPEALFLFYIAKKVVVVGDDKQISPEDVGIPPEDVEQIKERFIKSYPHKDAFGTNNSLFTIADIFFSHRIVLREHFRCMPEIIQFSNNLCYSNTPLIPLRQYPPERLDPIKHVHVKEGYREGAASNAINRPEAEEIVKTIKQCCEDPAYDGKTIGVITLLGNKQAALIDKMLLENIPPEIIEKRNIICGNPYAFQGDERDIIFLSMVAAPGDVPMSALTRQSDVQRFNVAASRAKDQIWLFHTPTLNDFRNHECLRYKLLSYYINPKMESAVGSIDKCESEFERSVFDRITNRGYRVIPQFHVAGYYIDLVVQGMKGQLAVECDGDFWHGPERYESDMARQRVLERCGWTFFRIRGSEYYRNPDAALDKLWDKLEELRIAPGGIDIRPPINTNEAVEENIVDEERYFDLNNNEIKIEDSTYLITNAIHENATVKEEVKQYDSGSFQTKNVKIETTKIEDSNQIDFSYSQTEVLQQMSKYIFDVNDLTFDEWELFLSWLKVNPKIGLDKQRNAVDNIVCSMSEGSSVNIDDSRSAITLYNSVSKPLIFQN